MRALALLSLFLAGPAVAQDEPHLDLKLLETCQEQVGSPYECIGASAELCLKSVNYAPPAASLCYGFELDYWDELLNLTYADALAGAKALDEELGVGGYPPAIAEESLRAMQRQWIAYRDYRCDFYISTWRGGTGSGPASVECAMRTTAEQVFVLRALMENLLP